MARAAAVLLLLLLCGCSGASATTTPEASRRFADYHGTSSPSEEQCALPVSQRTGGWICPSPWDGIYPRPVEDVGEPDEASPGIYVPTDADRGRLLYTLEVDGETFAVHSRGSGFDYDWISGPNKGYGFGSSGGTDSREAHEESIRAFLGMIDPATGYIAD